ncbi:hypothetical protein [Fusibacter sp. 3D3]|uniref:hypothetical protein n=1 Tax=Fusibacter sp. 3D3 TaxID=1048380 RepID=UPI000853A90E|nr:hypothetical protein [Fusibacter sp. 3D3]GAU78384.1 hypothetical protein F3D3_3017 [Fusibacter sp. 3D3]
METKTEVQYILTPYRRTINFAIEVYFYYAVYCILFIVRGHIYSGLFMAISLSVVTLIVLKQLNIYNIVINRQQLIFKKALGKDFSIKYEDIQKIGLESYGDSRLRSITIYLYSYDRIYEHKVSRYDINVLIEILEIKCTEHLIELDTKDLAPMATSWLATKLNQLWQNQKIK